MIRTLACTLGLLLAAVFAAVAGASAQTAPPNNPPSGALSTPVPPPTPPSNFTPVPMSPTLMAWTVLDEHNFSAYALPYDFHFVEQVAGYGFKPGERVTLTTSHVSAAPVRVTAEQYGGFNVRVSYDWTFCGPHGTTAPPPSFQAVGSQGSSATFTQPAPACPGIALSPQQPVPIPVQGSGQAAGPGVAQPSGTVVVQPAGTPPPTHPPIVPPPGPASPPEPVPQITPRPQTLTFNLTGFGFAPGEHVTLRGTNLTSSDLDSLSISADALGRFRASFQATVTCSAAPPFPEVSAVGDKGTTAVTHLNAYMACWVSPCSGDLGLPCVAPPGDVPVPAPGPAQGTSASADPGLAIRLHATAVARGGMQHAAIQADAPGTVAVTTRYPGGRATHRTVSVGTSLRAAAQWRVPRGAGRGTAKVEADFQPGGEKLTTTFRVK